MKNGITAMAWKPFPACGDPEDRADDEGDEDRRSDDPESRASQRGTSRARYKAVPSISALKAAMFPPMIDRPVADRDQSLADGDEGLRIARGRALLAQRDDGEEAEDADRDDRGFEQPGRDIPDRETFVYAPDDREQGHATGDAAEDVDELEHGADRDLPVSAGARR